MGHERSMICQCYYCSTGTLREKPIKSQNVHVPSEISVSLVQIGHCKQLTRLVQSLHTKRNGSARKPRQSENQNPVVALILLPLFLLTTLWFCPIVLAVTPQCCFPLLLQQLPAFERPVRRDLLLMQASAESRVVRIERQELWMPLN